MKSAMLYTTRMTPEQLRRVREAQHTIESARAYRMVVAKNAANGRWEMVEECELLESHSWIMRVHSAAAGRAKLSTLNTPAEIARFTTTSSRSN